MAASRQPRFLRLLLILFCIPYCTAVLEGIYCGKENCYDVLGVTRDSSKTEIGKAYRQLARKHHPDMHRTQEAKKKAEGQFTAIATAYEILRDEESRKEYDYMLDNPDEIYRHYYHYYRRRMAPKVDVRYVIVISITVISVIQYLNAVYRYRSAISYLITVPKYRIKAMDIAKRDGLVGNAKKKGKKSKDEIREEEEEALKKVLEENMDIRGGYAKPSMTDVLWVQLILLPYTIFNYVCWYMRWLWKFTIKGEEYGEEEKLYIIRKFMKCSLTQWEAIDESEKEEFLDEELWIKSKFEVWRQIKEEEIKAKWAESARYRSNRRYMKNHGPGQMTFEE